MVKFCISLTLILSFALPLCAFGDASTDAFITKTEFDAALKNFNDRLSIFEAGINSKIDTQVSSYLDRNGIWSKKEQTFSNAVFNVWANGTYAGYGNLKLYNTITNFKGSTILATNVITKSDKSGLMYVEYQDSCSSSAINSMQARFYYYKDKNNYNCDDSFSFIEKFLVLKDKIGANEVDWQTGVHNATSATKPPDTATDYNYATPAYFYYRQKGTTGAYTALDYASATKEEKMTVCNYLPVSSMKMNQTYKGERIVTLPWLDLKRNCHMFFVEKGDTVAYYSKVTWGAFISISASHQWDAAEFKEPPGVLSMSSLQKKFLAIEVY